MATPVTVSFVGNRVVVAPPTLTTPANNNQTITWTPGQGVSSIAQIEFSSKLPTLTSSPFTVVDTNTPATPSTVTISYTVTVNTSSGAQHGIDPRIFNEPQP